jgi:polar amino acid transport system permease protein
VLVATQIHWHVVWDRIVHPDHVFARALWTTIYIAVLAQALGVVLGLIAALMRMSKFAPAKVLAYTYILIFRGTPLIVQIFFIYYGTFYLFGLNLFPQTVNFGLFNLSGAALAGIIALGVNEGAYMSEIIRAGIDSVDRGQMEAAKSLGMTHRLGMRRIVLPQAARVIVPPLGNEFNNMLKNTSLLAFIGVYELFEDADVHYSSTFLPAEYFMAVAFWYLVLTTVWSVIQAWIERRLSASDRDTELSFWERLTQIWDRNAVVGRVSGSSYFRAGR